MSVCHRTIVHPNDSLTSHRVLILGGTGTISAGITAQLLEAGSEVVHLNRGLRGRPSGVRTITGDRRSPDDLRRALAAGPFDAVIDMVGFTPSDADVAIEVFGGKVPQYVFCSTVDVYTKTVGAYPLTEDAERAPSRSFPYAYDKQRAEEALERAAAAGAFDLTVLRPAATYRDSAVAPYGTYPLLVERIARGEPVILHGDGSSIWSSCHRDDVAAAFVRSIGNKRARGGAFTLASGELLTWNRYWTTVAEAMGEELAVVHIPTDVLNLLDPEGAEWCRENFQYDNIYDTTAAEDVLGFASRRTWREACASFDFDRAGQVEPQARERYEDVLRAWTGMVDDAVGRVSSMTAGSAGQERTQ